MSRSIRWSRRRSLAISVVSWSSALLSLLGGWCVLYLMVGAMTEVLLVPWDFVGVDDRPALGTWQRTVNDTFETTAAWWPSGVVVALSVLHFGLQSRHGLSAARMGWYGCVAIVGSLALPTFAMAGLSVTQLWLDPTLPREVVDVGYQRTWLGVALSLVTLLGMVRLQVGGPALLAQVGRRPTAAAR